MIMDRKLILGSLSALLLTACNSTPQSTVTNYEADENLASSQQIECVPVTELSNTNNPVDIFGGLNSCLSQQDYSNAAQLYFAGMSYGFFDTKRVSDKTAHQAISVLRMNVFGAQSQDTLASFQAALENVTSDNSDTCQRLAELGPPAYKPTYMIQHGMAAFTGQTTKDGLVENFDSNTVWQDTLNTVLKCLDND